MPRSIRSTSIIHSPLFSGDESTTIGILKRQPLPHTPYTSALLEKWSAFCEKANPNQSIPKPEVSGQRKRMLIISVAEYTGDLKVLEGSKTDWKIWAMLGTMAGWSVEILADTVQPADPKRSPTTNNIRHFARALLHGNCKGDQYIVAYSGHCDEKGLILANESQISPLELHDMFAKPLTTGSVLWTFFDCCRSSNLLQLPQKITLNKNQLARCQPFNSETQSMDGKVEGTVISIGSAADAAGELGLSNAGEPHQLRCGSLAFAAYYFFHSVLKTGEPLLDAFIPCLMKFLASRPGQEAQFTASTNLQAPLLPLLRPRALP